MKTLLKKEIKLGINPICYFCLAFVLLLFIPSYPLAIVFFFPFTIIANVFLSSIGDNNDLEFSLLLPIRKKDYALAKLLSLNFIELLFLLVSIPFALIRYFLLSDLYPTTPGFSSFLVIYGSSLIGYGLFNLLLLGIYFKTYPKKGMANLVSIFSTLLVMSLLGIVLAYIPVIGKNLEENNLMGLIFLLVSIFIYIVLNYLTYIISFRNIDKLNP